MRTKNIVPVGRDCKQVTLLIGIHKRKEFRLCKCHMHLYLNRRLGCGDLFHTDRPQTKTCSDRCRKRLSRMRNEKMFQTVMNLTGGSV